MLVLSQPAIQASLMVDMLTLELAQFAMVHILEADGALVHSDAGLQLVLLADLVLDLHIVGRVLDANRLHVSGCVLPVLAALAHTEIHGQHDDRQPHQTAHHGPNNNAHINPSLSDRLRPIANRVIPNRVIAAPAEYAGVEIPVVAVIVDHLLAGHFADALDPGGIDDLV